MLYIVEIVVILLRFQRKRSGKGRMGTFLSVHLGRDRFQEKEGRLSSLVYKGKLIGGVKFNVVVLAGVCLRKFSHNVRL